MQTLLTQSLAILLQFYIRLQSLLQCLLTSMQVTSILQQTYMFVTVDLAAAKIAYDIIWGNPDKFSKVVSHLGTCVPTRDLWER